MKKIKLILFLIIIIAAFLRFWELDKVPPSLYWDEVSQGYNSYSILKTGHDEHDEFLPLASFKAFGDYKAPVYIYADVPFIALFGKSSFAVRFPSALFGVLTVLITFILVKELFYSRKEKELLGLGASFLLAISPWHIQLSRVAYEGNIATFFTVLGIYLFFRAKRKESWIFIFSIASFVLGFYAFNAHRVFIPLLIIFLILIFIKNFLSKKKIVFLACTFGFILLIPFLLYLKTPESKLRFNEVNIFTNLDIVKQSNKWIEEDNNSKLANILYNRRVLFALSYASHYLDFFNPKYLFFKGDVNTRFSLQDNGELFLWELPFILVGFYQLLKHKNKHTLFILGWFLLAPVAAATARETPHALRSETYIPTYEIMGSLGLISITDIVKKRTKKIYLPAMFIFGTVVFLSIFIFIHNYFIHFPISFAQDFQYGYKEAVREVEKIKKNYDYVVFTNNYGRQYIYTLFYGNIEPEVYWKEGKVERDSFGFYNVKRIGNYIFREKVFDEEEDRGKKVLYVAAPSEMKNSYKILKKISFPDQSTAFIIATN